MSRYLTSIIAAIGLTCALLIAAAADMEHVQGELVRVLVSAK